MILADEINRAPAKVQSALLEAMEERQVTLAGETLRLPEPFLVMATQNPVEQEGVYPLPEAQVDRFMLKLRVDYPSREEEIEIVRSRTSPGELESAAARALRRRDHGAARDGARAPRRGVAASSTRCALVAKSRTLGAVELGGSPRASIYLIEAARARAYLEQRDYVLPEDVKRVAPAVLRHRLLLSYEAEAEGQTSDAIIRELLAAVPTP